MKTFHPEIKNVFIRNIYGESRTPQTHAHRRTWNLKSHVKFDFQRPFLKSENKSGVLNIN